MSYIIKNTAGLINTRLTDVGRRNISQGNFAISYFQIGDSEVNYTAVPNYNQTNNSILMPAFNAQNDTGSPQSNKQNVKYPYYVQGNAGNTFGIPTVPGGSYAMIDDTGKMTVVVNSEFSDAGHIPSHELITGYDDTE
jgi:hypothetical protein